MAVYLFFLFSFISCFGETFSLQPEKLLVKDNFGILAKYIFAHYEQLNVESSWHKELFEETMKCLDPFISEEEVEKSKQKLKLTLSQLANKNAPNIEPVKINSDFTIISGDEVAIAGLILHQEVPCERVNEIPLITQDHYTLKEKGLRQDFLDAMALTYCKLNQKTRLALIWPLGISYENTIKKMWKEVGSIVYEKSFDIQNQAGYYLLHYSHIKEKHDWRSYLLHYFPAYLGPKFKVIALLIDSDLTTKEIKRTKRKIRKVIDRKCLSLHIDDEHEESVLSSRALLSDNNIHFMNAYMPKNFRVFLSLFKRYKSYLTKTNAEMYCLDHTSLPAFLGISDLGQLQFFTKESTQEIDKKIQNRNRFLDHDPSQIDEIIFNPNNYFYFDDLKVAYRDFSRSLYQK